MAAQGSVVEVAILEAVGQSRKMTIRRTKDVSDNSQTEASLRPVLLLLVGASGAGKTTFYETHLKTVFPKVLKTSASPLEQAESDRRWKCLLKERQSFVYVSDLFDLEVIRDVRAAGYETKAVYLATEDSNLNLGRVLIRTNNGGRFAPISRIANDHTQGLRQLPRVKKLTDDLMLFDNTAHGRDVRLVAHFKVGKLVKLAREIPKWAQKGLRTEIDKWGATSS